jgi:hypothetical protein
VRRYLDWRRRDRWRRGSKGKIRSKGIQLNYETPRVSAQPLLLTEDLMLGARAGKSRSQSHPSTLDRQFRQLGRGRFSSF